MKKIFSLILLLIFSAIFAQFATSAEISDSTKLKDERILSYHSDIDVQKNSSIIVTEKIKVNVLGIDIRRGIFRTLPLYRNLNGKTQNIKYNIISIKKNGADEDYHTETDGGNEKIYIGSKDVFLENGQYEYELKYEVPKQIGFFDKYDELYWNVNGNDWDFPVDSVFAKVNLPEGAEILQNSCYSGSYGSKSQNCDSKILSKTSIGWYAKDLSRNEGLTIAVGFKKGILIAPPPPSFFEKFGLLIFAILILLGLLYYYFTSWQKYGVDPQKPIVYPQFNAPGNLSPASVGYLKSGYSKDNFVTASLVSLATKGFIKITESKPEDGLSRLLKSKVFTLEKLKNYENSLPKEEFVLMSKFFKRKDVAEIDGEYDEDIAVAVDQFKENLKLQHESFLNDGNNFSKLWIPAGIITGGYFLGLLVSNLINQDSDKMLFGLILFGVLAGIFLVIIWISNVLFTSWKNLFFITPIAIFVFVNFGKVLGHNFFIDNNFNICYIFLFLAWISLLVYKGLIKNPTEQKLKTLSQIDGFKMYMKAAEDEVLKFHNPPQMTPDVFEKLLPYAIVFGVDKIWGERFKNYLSQTAQPYESTWYVGNMGSYNYNFGNLTNSFTSSITSSSSSDSGSGSGGGGFSGGGGGGGGGGGW